MSNGGFIDDLDSSTLRELDILPEPCDLRRGVPNGGTGQGDEVPLNLWGPSVVGYDRYIVGRYWKRNKILITTEKTWTITL